MTFALILISSALAQAPDYDAFSDPAGNITTEQHGVGLFNLLRQSGQVESLYADAARGDARARKVFQTLETDYFPDYGRELAELVNRPPCFLPVFRELSGWCVPDWTFLDFLNKDQPGGAKLRKALFEGYSERARQRGLEARVVLSAMNALLGVRVAATAMREAEVVVRVVPRVASPAPNAISRLGSMDARVVQRAAELARQAASGFPNDLAALSRATTEIIGPSGRIHLIGELGGKRIFGSAISRVGIVETERGTAVVRAPAGQPVEVLGPFGGK
jgi:hypothetical protein